LFSGTVPDRESAMARRGDTLTLPLTGWSSRIAEPFRDDVTFDGPVAADAVFVALCQMQGVPSYIAEAATYPDGVTPLMLGGNQFVDDGLVRFRANSSPLSQFQRLVEPYGYYVTDSLTGPVVFHRVSGKPTGRAVVAF